MRVSAAAYTTLCRIIIKSLHCTNSIMAFEMHNSTGILGDFVVCVCVCGAVTASTF